MSQAALTSNKALKSRRERPIKRRGRILFFSARGADMQACHGPLQRLLEVTVLGGTVRVRPSWRNPRRHSLPVSAPLRWERRRSAPRAQRPDAAAAIRVCVGARPGAESKLRRPHAHSVASNEDVCRGLSPMSPKSRRVGAKQAISISSLSFSNPSDF